MAADHVLAIGVFGLFHVGHLRYLQAARQRAGRLTVAVTTDAIALAFKGKQPVLPEAQRLEIVAALACVDRARLQPASTEQTDAAACWIADWGIERVTVGGGWEGSPRWQRLAPRLEARGIAVEFLPYTAGISTTDIVARVRGET